MQPKHGFAIAILMLLLLTPAWPLVGMTEPFVSEGEFLHSEGENGSQTNSQVVYGSEQYLAVWQEMPRRSTTINEIRAARLKPDGQNLDAGGFRVAARPSYFAMARPIFDGEQYYLAWIEYPRENLADDPGVIYGARVDPHGRVLEPGGRILDGSRIRKDLPDLAFGDHGGLLVWRQGGNQIIARRLDPRAGTFDERQIIVFEGKNAMSPHVAHTAGVFLVVWERWSGSAETEGLYAARVDTTGTVLDVPAIQLAKKLGHGRNALLAADAKGFLVIWENGWESTENGVKGISLQGAKVGVDGRVTELDSLSIAGGSIFKTLADVAFDGTNYLIAWWEVQPFSDSASKPFPPSPFIVPEKKEMRAARVSPTGRILEGHGFTIRPETEPIVFRVDRESLACDGRSRCLVTYTDFDHRLHIKKFRISRRVIDLRDR
ncbi:MAG: hypothetical protein GX444_05925 [Myxococcales bacterium]|nr:hypothetical protein [Myxococcales bacterium]